MAHRQNTLLPTQGQLLFAPIDTKMAQVLAEARDLARACPEILARVETDLDALAQRKKALRLADQLFAAESTLPLPLEVELARLPTPLATALPLDAGRPRTPAMVVYCFLVLRGHYGSVSDLHSWERFADSLTLRSFLDPYVDALPGRTTLIELLNAVSLATRSFILDKQLERALGEGLDDFRKQTIDSTAVAANSAWPTDVELIAGLLERAFRLGRALGAWEVRAFRTWHTERWFAQLQAAKLTVLLSRNQRPRQRRKRFAEFIAKADQLLMFLHGEHDARDVEVAQAPLPPSRHLQLDRLWAVLGDALRDADILLTYLSAKHVGGEEIARDEWEKIFSLSDGSAAFIVKGGRDTVFGYKAQLGRSEHGFITSVSLPAGNAADSAQLVPMVTQHLTRTGVVPAFVTADDGYASSPHAATLKTKFHVQDVSITGAKGRRQLGEALWLDRRYVQSRADRSSVESLMATLKHDFAFARCHRRGLDAVREEILEKVIAYNFWRLHYERHRQAEQAEQRRRKRQAA